MKSACVPLLQALARQAVVYCLPLYEMARARSAGSARRNAKGEFAGTSPDSTMRWLNAFVHTRKLLSAESRHIVTPNNDTLYSNAWLDLADGPVLLTVPDTGQRYYVLGLVDFYSNPFGYLGTRTTGNLADRYLIHGPDWKGAVPEGVTSVSAPTNAVWLAGRLMVDASESLETVHGLQDRFDLTRLDGTSAAIARDVVLQPQEQLQDAGRFVDIVNLALHQNPPPVREQAMVDGFRAIGIGAGMRASNMEPHQLNAVQQAIADVLDEVTTPQTSTLEGGWHIPAEVEESFGEDYLGRAQVAKNYIGVLGKKEAMYVVADRDSLGQPLHGTHSYELKFAANNLPRVRAFWSISMYRKSDCLFAANLIDRYSVGDRSPGLIAEEDGSLRIFLTHAPPEDPRYLPHWLPAPQEGAFYIVLRLYLPEAAHLENSYVYPSIVRQ